SSKFTASCVHGVERRAPDQATCLPTANAASSRMTVKSASRSKTSPRAVIGTPQATLASALMAACMEAGVAIVLATRHTPSGLAFPSHRHHRQSVIARWQADAKDSLKKRLRQEMVRRKILNQSAVLVAAGSDGAATLKEIARHVEPRDPDNVEARAARFYWSRLFTEFTRDDPADRRNKLLNYGYAVVRAGVARALVAAGLGPALGIGHQAASTFNLADADDVLEPFRPFVDLMAWKMGANEKDGNLSIEDRRAMAGALLVDARSGEDSVTLLVAAETAAQSLVRAFEKRESRATPPAAACTPA